MIPMNRYYKVGYWQLGMLIILAILVIIKTNTHNGISLILGGFIAVIAYLWFTYRTIAGAKVKSSSTLAVLANRGVIEKYVIAASGFATVFSLYKPSEPIYVFCGYIIAIYIQIYGVGKLSQQQAT